MALFGFTDINFNKGARNLTGPISSLLGSNYEYDILKYPTDVGSYDKGHYMVIHINSQNRTQFASKIASDSPNIVENFNTLNKPNVSNLTEAVSRTVSDIGNVLGGSSEVGAKVVDATRTLLSGASGASGTNRVFTRTIQRTTETIALYMPDTLNFTHNQSYSDVSLGGGIGGALLTGGGTAIADIIQSFRDSKGLNDALQILGNQAPGLVDIGVGAVSSNFGRFGQVFVAAGLERAINPLLELLYSSPSLRQFRFDFLFYPRTEREAQEVQKILNKLKFHQAPEIDRKTSGFFLVPPSEFDIKFYYNGTENPNIPKISTCVLETIDVDYAPNGFAAYEIPSQLTPTEGGTGMPVSIRLSLQFKETEIMTKDNFKEGGQSDLSRILSRDPNNIV